MPLFKTLIFTILFPGTVTILIPRWLLMNETLPPVGVLRFIGLVPILIGVPIYLWCALDFAILGKGTPIVFDPPKVLVARGLYRFVRNPMYVGILSILIGEAALFTSLTLAGFAAVMALIFHTFVVLYEEPNLRKRFGESYRSYCAQTPRWFPEFKSSVNL
ncbi:MAG: methyltransferase family protein [Blastocatellia bacterium]